MPKFKVAHIREQGVDLIIVPLAPAFDQQSEDSKASDLTQIQMAASAARLAGTVVPVWRVGGRMKFIAPTNWHAFFRSLPMATIQASLNREISW